MKHTKKTPFGKQLLIAALCVVMLAAATISGTVAYLTDTASVVNTFTVGSVDITLSEEDVDPTGTPIDGAARVTGNEYHLVPGKTYVKDPTLTVVKGSEECYVRLLVTVNEIAALNAIADGAFLPENYVQGWDREVWQCVKIGDTVDDTITYEFRYFETVSAFDAAEDVVLDALFDSFTVPADMTKAELASISDLTVTVVGHAIQAAGFDSADAAWSAFSAD